MSDVNGYRCTPSENQRQNAAYYRIQEEYEQMDIDAVIVVVWRLRGGTAHLRGHLTPPALFSIRCSMRRWCSIYNLSVPADAISVAFRIPGAASAPDTDH